MGKFLKSLLNWKLEEVVIMLTIIILVIAYIVNAVAEVMHKLIPLFLSLLAIIVIVIIAKLSTRSHKSSTKAKKAAIPEHDKQECGDNCNTCIFFDTVYDHTRRQEYGLEIINDQITDKHFCRMCDDNEETIPQDVWEHRTKCPYYVKPKLDCIEVKYVERH